MNSFLILDLIRFVQILNDHLSYAQNLSSFSFFIAVTRIRLRKGGGRKDRFIILFKPNFWLCCLTFLKTFSICCYCFLFSHFHILILLDHVKKISEHELFLDERISF